MILQLNPPIPLDTPKGKAIAHFMVDYGIEHHWLWVCFHEDGECWTWQNTDIKAKIRLALQLWLAETPGS